jgi:hypothetical protein
MRNVLKLELGRAFRNRAFAIAVSIGIAIVLFHMFSEFIPFAAARAAHSDIYYSGSIFNMWIGLDWRFATSLFFLVFPLFAAIPFADSYLADRKSGYVKNIFTRTDKGHWLTAKFVAVFLSAGAAVAIPLLADLFVTALFMPAITPTAASGRFPLSARYIGASLFHTHPFVYVFVWIAILFAVSGILASVALSFSFFARYRYAVLITPFLWFMLISLTAMILGEPTMDIRDWVISGQLSPVNPVIIVAEMGVTLAFAASVYFVKGHRDDTL